jgi:DNA polymerase
MRVWLETQGLKLDNTRKETLDAILDDDAPEIDGEVLPGWDEPVSPKARRAIELMRALGRSSTAKYGKMRDWMDPRDARLRGGLLYHGAGTGRWAGKGVQPHNFPKGSQSPLLKKTTQDELWVVLKNG